MADVPIDAGRVSARVADARKYRAICPDTMRRISQWAAARAPSENEAVKIAKRKLHQIYAAFLPTHAKTDIRKLTTLAIEQPEQRLQACRKILGLHASTAERLPYYGAIGELLRPLVRDGGAVVDLACGLNPFALPLIGWPSSVRYRASDIDCELTALADDFLKAILPDARSVCSDVLGGTPPEAADLVLLLKSAPTLEQQEKGATRRLVETMTANAVVISFPCRSLGGHNRGMRETYRAQAAALKPSWSQSSEEHLIGDELFYILRRRTPGA